MLNAYTLHFIMSLTFSELCKGTQFFLKSQTFYDNKALFMYEHNKKTNVTWKENNFFPFSKRD